MDPDGRAGRELLVLAEPGVAESPRTAEILAEPPTHLLIVLPKWKAIRDTQRSKWIRGVESVDASEQLKLLTMASIPGSVARRDWPANWQINETGLTPSGSNWVQLVHSAALRPIVGDGSGILVGEWKRGDRTVWVLSDPDIMANHGIGTGDNAAFMLALFAAMEGAGTGMPIVFDESVHGYSLRRTSPLRLLFEFPLVVATVLAVLSALLLVLAGAQRFGMPDRAGQQLGFGKESLIDSSARLMAYAGHEYPVLRRYVLMNIRSVAEALHAPQKLDESDLAAWLDRHARSPVPGLTCGDILRRIQSLRADTGDLTKPMACADDIHRWRESVLSARGGGRTKAKNTDRRSA